MKTTLDLPDDLMRELKIRAATQGKKLKDVTAETLRRGLSSNHTTTATSPLVIKQHPTLGFPMVECGHDAPATKMTIEEILKIEQDTLAAEDLKRVGLSL